MYSYKESEKVTAPPLASKRLLDQVRERIRELHYSPKTQKTYLYLVIFFAFWYSKQGSMQHPKEMGTAHV